MATTTTRNPAKTYTIAMYRACQSATEPSYFNFSFRDKVDYPYRNEVLKLTVYNVLSDYLDEIRSDYCQDLEFNDSEFSRYKYRPKLFCYDLYKATELYSIILLINDMYSFKQFTKKKIKAPNIAQMQELCRYIFNANKSALNNYN